MKNSPFQIFVAIVTKKLPSRNFRREKIFGGHETHGDDSTRQKLRRAIFGGKKFSAGAGKIVERKFSL